MPSQRGETPQLLAAANSHHALVDFFMHSSNAKAADVEHNTVLLWLCRHPGADQQAAVRRVLALLKKGANVNARNKVGVLCSLAPPPPPLRLRLTSRCAMLCYAVLCYAVLVVCLCLCCAVVCLCCAVASTRSRRVTRHCWPRLATVAHAWSRCCSMHEPTSRLRTR